MLTGVGVAAESESPSALEEIVVSAQRREERLIDAPISIGVLSGSDLDRGSSHGVSDVLNQVGGVSLIETQPGNAQIAIRGVVADAYSGTSTTGYYLDEVPFAFINTAQLPDVNAFDLSRVEVLRGPQGTLYGVNALSGVVRVLSADAELDNFQAKGRMRGSDTAHGSGNYGADLALNVPLIPGELAVRGVASYSNLSGFIDSSLTGQRRINDSESQAYRMKMNYKPLNNLNIKLGWTRSDINNGAPSKAFEDLTTPFSPDQADARVYDTYNLIAEYDWSHVSLLSSTSYFDYRADTQEEILLPDEFRLNYLNRYSLNSFSQEFRFASKLGGPWQWSAGTIYKDTKQLQLQSAPEFFAAPYEDKNRSESYAVFGETTRSLGGDKFAVTAGVRYFHDDLLSTELSNFFASPLTPPRPVTFERVTGRVVASYKPDAAQTFYASVASGFRSGVNQTSAVEQVVPSLGSVKPDSLISYEVGAKGEVFRNTLSYEAALYYTDWTDIQQGLILPIGFFAGVNVGDASGLGVDASARYQVTDAFTLQGGIGWNGLELDQDIFTSGVLLFAEGERLNNSPEWTGSVTGSYSIETPITGWRVVLSSTFSYRSPMTLRYLQGDLLTETESDPMRSLQADIGFQSDRWSLSLYGDNLTDDRGAITPPDITYANNSVRQRPRTIGLQVIFNY